MKLRDHARTTPVSLRLRRGISFDAWLGVGHQVLRISQMTNASAWWVGDWLVFGARAYGQKYQTALEATPLDYQTLRNYAWVARQIEMSRRRDKLSFQHHAEVASLPQTEQDLWLERAEKLNWSRNELRRQLRLVRAGGQPRDEDQRAADEPQVVVRLQVGAEREARWREAATAANQEFGDWISLAVDEAAAHTLESEPASTDSDRRPANGTRFGRAENGRIPWLAK